MPPKGNTTALKIAAAKNLFEWIAHSLSITPGIHIYRNQKDSIIFSAYSEKASQDSPYIEVTYWNDTAAPKMQIKLNVLVPIPQLKLAIEDRPILVMSCDSSDDFKRIYDYIYTHKRIDEDE